MTKQDWPAPAQSFHGLLVVLRLGAAAALLALALAPPAWALADEGFISGYRDCRATRDEIARLRCYDGLAPLLGAPAEAVAEPVLTPEEREEQQRRSRRLAELEALALREERGRLSADEPNYFVYATPIDDKLDDDKHVEFYISLKYPLVDSWFDRVQDRYRSDDSAAARLINGVTPDRLLLHYNGLYDFYTVDDDRYESAPIISRAQNPGASLEFDFSEGRKKLRLGWFHESNGQQLEAGEFDQFQRARDENGDDFALAEVSRGWDYAQLRWTDSNLFNEDPLAIEWFTYQLETRFFCDCQAFGFIDGREDDIWWDDGNSARISDYDGLRAMAQRSFLLEDFALDARLDLKTGLEHSFGEYLSGRLTLGAKWENLRLTLFYFNGYGRDPSTYHLRTEYAGLGLELR